MKQESVTIEIRYLAEGLIPLDYIDGKSDWIDLRAAETVELKQGEYRLIPLGIAMKLPEGYEAHVAPRSSSFKNFGIIMVNSMGIIDNSYSGDNDQWFVPVLAMRDTVIRFNDRIAQFRIMRNQPPVRFELKEHLGEVDRGGFGVTGIR